MSSRVVDPQPEQRKRDLRLKIGRLRRRIDRHVRGSERELRRLASWQTYVRRFPGHAIVAAMGVGLALSSGLRPAQLARWISLGLARRVVDRTLRQIGDELHRIWADSTPGNTVPSGTEAEHE
jgi:hypothetical protein